MKSFPILGEKIEVNPNKEDNKFEIRKIKAELEDDIAQAKGNKSYSYMRNYKFFKDHVLIPSGEMASAEEFASCINTYGEKIFKQS